MVVVDANVLLYAANTNAPHHETAAPWIDDALSGDEPVGFAWVVVLAFLRLATLPAVFPTPLAASDALDLVDDWLGAAPATVVNPTSRHAAILRGFVLETGTAANLTSDAHVAALAVEHGGRVCTFDRDFGRFTGLSWFTPGADR